MNTAIRAELTIDASHGEGGGQVLRTAAAIATITGRPIIMTDIRAARPKPGLAAQHITAVRAAAAICDASVTGDELGSTSLSFSPRRRPCAGRYRFDVSDAREGGSAGSVNLILQTVLLPLVFAEGTSEVTAIGGTHIPWSPSFEYLAHVWLPALARLGIRADAELLRSGWFPRGNGEVLVGVRGLGPVADRAISPLQVMDRGALTRVTGSAIAASLPSHIAQRMFDRGMAVLRAEEIAADIRPLRLKSDSPGAGVFLAAHYEHITCGFDAHGKRGLPSEDVAEAATTALLDHHRGAGALDKHLADQMLLPLALASAPSRFTCQTVTPHLETAAWLIEQFGIARIRIERGTGTTGVVTVVPT